MDDGPAEFGGKDARAGHDQFVSVHRRIHPVRIHAGQRDQHDHLAFRLQDIDRRLPGRHPRREPCRPEQLPMQPFRTGQHLAGFRPHPVAYEVAVHRALSPVFPLVIQDAARHCYWTEADMLAPTMRASIVCGRRLNVT